MSDVAFIIWVAVFAATSLFWTWVLFWGGAELLEGSFLSRILIHNLASRWSAQGIKLFGGLIWFLEGIWIVVLTVAWFRGHLEGV